MTPRLNTTAVEKINPMRRPRKSATGADVNAPRNVPKDKIDTIRDSSEEETTGVPCSFVSPVENSRSHTGICRIPEMVPVSYPNSSPPKATNSPTTMAGHAAPGSSAGFLNAKPILKIDREWKLTVTKV